MELPPDPPLYNEEKLPPLVPLEQEEAAVLMAWDGDDLPILSPDPIVLPAVNNFQDFEKAIKLLANNEVQLVFSKSLMEFVKSKKMSLQQMLFYKNQIKKPFFDQLVEVKIEAFKRTQNKSSVPWAKHTCATVVESFTVEELKLARRAGPWFH